MIEFLAEFVLGRGLFLFLFLFLMFLLSFLLFSFLECLFLFRSVVLFFVRMFRFSSPFFV